MLPGIKIRQLTVLPDERGMFCELLREDWSEIVEGERILQTNVSLTFPGVIRAWHRHGRGQIDNFVVLRGAIKICAYDDRPDSKTRGELTEIVSSGDKLQIVRVPGFYWHGIKAIGNDPALLLYFVNNLYDYKNPDEERRPWNDPDIIDPRTKQPYDWNRPPHR
jgi:dTDP-4-dehydrorhamnose 3,5-epimerase